MLKPTFYQLASIQWLCNVHTTTTSVYWNVGRTQRYTIRSSPYVNTRFEFENVHTYASSAM